MICAYCHKAPAAKIYCKPCMAMLRAEWRERLAPKPERAPLIWHTVCRVCGKPKPRTLAERCRPCSMAAKKAKGQGPQIYTVCRDCSQPKRPSLADRCQPCAGIARRSAPRFTNCKRCGEPKHGKSQYAELCPPCQRDTLAFNPAHNTVTTPERMEAARKCRALLAASLLPRLTPDGTPRNQEGRS